jgi:RimJ/RimL family protein N-acetyltransferase
MAADKAVASNLCAAIAPDGRNTFVITSREDRNAALGCAGYGVARDMPGSTEIGVWIGIPWWGRGYATEAVQALVDRAFGEDRLKALWCSSRVTNTRARRVIEKCGFQFRGTGMVRSPTAFGAFPVERFVLDRRNWESLKAWGARRHSDETGNGGKEAQRESAA